MDGSTSAALLAAKDHEEFPLKLFGSVWRLWWQSDEPSTGHRHGADAICLTPEADLLIIREQSGRWDLPGGRVDAGESWEQTLRREVAEEACATVGEARMLGFWVADCDEGPYQGKRLIRSLWLAHVTLDEWAPEFEVAERRVIPVSEWSDHVRVGSQFRPMICRAFAEAGLL